MTVHYEGMQNDQYFTRLGADPPAFWALGWVADYPGPNDFLGLLLGTGSVDNYGRWSSPDFDAAIGGAGSTTDPPRSVRPTTRRRRSSSTTCRSSRCPTTPAMPSPGTGSSGRPRAGSASSASPGSRGQISERRRVVRPGRAIGGRALLATAAAFALALGLTVVPGRRRRRSRGEPVRDPHGDGHVRDRGHVRPAIHAAGRHPSRRGADHRPGRDRPTGDPGPGAVVLLSRRP